MLTIIALVVVFLLVWWAISYIPLPPEAPPFIKPLLYVIWCLVGAYYVWTHYVR
jgi:hypothetical protein